MSYHNKNHLGLGQPGYAAERYSPTSLGQASYAPQRYVSMSGLGQTKTDSTTASKAGTVDNTERDFRMAADVGGSLVSGLVRGFTGGGAPTPAAAEPLPVPPAPEQGGGADWYWPVVISGGLILVGGIGYFALKGKKSAPTPNKRRKRVSRNAYGRSRYGSYSNDPRWMAAKYPGVDSEGKSFKKGDEILYWPSTKTVMTGAKAKQAWLDFLSAKGDEEGMPFARNSRRKRSSRR